MRNVGLVLSGGGARGAYEAGVLRYLLEEFPESQEALLSRWGYPYVMELGTLAKNFRNVFIDMCWGSAWVTLQAVSRVHLSA